MRIDFLHPEFHKGLNTTVRRGQRDYKIGETIELFETNMSKPVAVGKITALHILPFKDVTEEMIKNQHDAETQTLPGLVKAMDRAYANTPLYGPEYPVTIVEFWID